VTGAHSPAARGAGRLDVAALNRSVRTNRCLTSNRRRIWVSLLERCLMRCCRCRAGELRATHSQLILAARGDFFVTLRGFAPDGQSITALRLGRYLSKNKDRRINGMRIVEAGERSGSKLWQLERLNA
jgi:hypothetical protein